MNPLRYYLFSQSTLLLLLRNKFINYCQNTILTVKIWRVVKRSKSDGMGNEKWEGPRRDSGGGMMRSGFMSKTTTLQNVQKNQMEANKNEHTHTHFGILTATRKQDTR
jgi:hypothetical protein